MATEEILTHHLVQKYGHKIAAIGKGAYGQIYLYEGPNGLVAIKRMVYGESILDRPPFELRTSSIIELAVMRQLSIRRHPNIISMVDYDISKDIKLLYLVLEYAKRGDMLHYLRKKQSIDEKTIKSFTYQMLSGLAYIHSLGIIHADLSPQNLFIFSNGRVKIGDFGQSIPLACTYIYKNTNVTALDWRAPELLLPTTRNYNQKIDIWSAGSIIFYMLVGMPPFLIKFDDAKLKQLAIKDMGIEYANSIDYNRENEMKLLQLKEIWKVLGTVSSKTWPNFSSERLKFWTREHVHYKNNQYVGNPSLLSLNIKKAGIFDAEKWVQLLRGMLVLDPGKRINAHELLKNPLFNEVRDVKYESKGCDCLSNLILAQSTIPSILSSNQKTSAKYILNTASKLRLPHASMYQALQLNDLIANISSDKELLAYASLYLANNFRASSDRAYITPKDLLVHATKKYNEIEFLSMCTTILRTIDFQMVFSNTLDLTIAVIDAHNKDPKISHISYNSRKMAYGFSFYVRVSEKYREEPPLQMALLCIALANVYYGEEFSYAKEFKKELWPQKGIKLPLIDDETLGELFLRYTKNISFKEALDTINKSQINLAKYQKVISVCSLISDSILNIEELDNIVNAPYFDLSANNYILLDRVKGNKALITKLIYHSKIATPKKPDLYALGQILKFMK